MTTGQTVYSCEDVTSFSSKAVEWLTRLGVVQQGLVADMFVTVKTTLESPVLFESCDSRFSIRRDLNKSGWEGLSGREASLESKRYNSEGPLDYFLLLKHHMQALQSYNAEFGLRHSQPKAYYEALLCCFSRSAKDPWELRPVLLLLNSVLQFLCFAGRLTWTWH